jgi:hypothetical protein
MTGAGGSGKPCHFLARRVPGTSGGRWPGPVHTALQLGLLSWLAVVGPAPALAQTPSPAAPEFPVALHGAWYEGMTTGRVPCRAQSEWGQSEPRAGSLWVSERQIREVLPQGGSTLYFLTRVTTLGRNSWQFQALVDQPPYEAPKVLQTGSLSQRGDRLYWSSTVMDADESRRWTRGFERCADTAR